MMVSVVSVVALSFFGVIGPSAAVKPDKWCYKEFPILDGLLCYKACKPGYSHHGGGPVCWANCPKRTVNLGLFCTKDTYGRGVGVPLSTCTASQDKNGLLCYPKCKSGYHGVGPVCWTLCKEGYTDDGLLCRKNAHIYGKSNPKCPWHDKCGLCGGPWYNVCGRRRNCRTKCPSGYKDDGCTCRRDVHIYAKGSYGRGVGSAMGCNAGEEKGAALCYPPCESGYYGVGPVCWASCSGETIDTGTQCQKKAYGRGIGKVINCLKLPTLNSITNYKGLVEIFEKAHSFEKIVAMGCATLYMQTKFWVSLAQTFNNCNKKGNWQTVTVSYSAGAAAGAAVGGEVGIGLDIFTSKGICYFGYCVGAKLDVSMGADLAIGWWRGLDDIPGKSKAWEIGVDIPFTEIGVTFVFITTADLTLIGTQIAFGVGIGGPLPIEAGWGDCDTPAENTMPFTA